MASSKRMNLICIAAIVLCLAASVLLPNAGAQTPVSMGYEGRLFDISRVHTIDISMDGWDSFIQTCQNEEYAACDVTVDGEKFKNVAIRAKGNTSLSSVSQMDSDRYSFKIEFDHYDDAFSYHGLDKLSLNNLIQDNTFMKDYLVYRMINAFGAPAPLASFAYITVNGEDWGLYLAVEGVEDAFLMRNYGKNHGELYKPDSMSFGGGRGNGRNFSFDGMQDIFNIENAPSQGQAQRSGMPFGGMNFQSPPDTAGNAGFEFPPDMPDKENSTGGNRDRSGGFSFSRGASDVKLQYIDDSFESYKNIFDNAKTDITDQDKTRLIEALKKLSQGDVQSVNTDAVLRYFVVHNFVVNDDSYTGSMIHNYYLYEKDGALSMIPWDYNLAFGTFQRQNASSSVNRDILNPVSGGMNDRPMIKWIFDSEEYTEKYLALFDEFLTDINPLSLIEETEALIDAYVKKDISKFCTYEEFKTGIDALISFVSLRTQSVRNQLDGNEEVVNTQNLTVSDMGTMSMGKRRAVRDTTAASASEGAQTPAQQFENPQNPQTDRQTRFGGDQSSANPRMNFPFAGGFSENPAAEKSPSGEMLLLISACVLAASLAFAYFFRR